MRITVTPSFAKQYPLTWSCECYKSCPLAVILYPRLDRNILGGQMERFHDACAAIVECG